jgi:hypothetical protein
MLTKNFDGRFTHAEFHGTSWHHQDHCVDDLEFVLELHRKRNVPRMAVDAIDVRAFHSS